MATDDVNISEDAEMAECDGDKVVTMMDVLQEQQDFEEDANAVLGASDDKNCTYPKGYIKRQALYACLTCCTEAKVDPTKRAGVCLACSLTCHENHELIELYTKRNFRCDCGNPKFNSNPCQFTSDKTELNDENIYNQNFSGLYCTCQRPYPDPESTIEDDMIQCIICEDWLHATHLGAVVPANDQYSEMVCKSCMEKNEFLHDYSIFAVTTEAADVDILTVNGDAKAADSSLCNGDLEKEKLVNGIEENKTEVDTTSVTVNGNLEMDEDKGKSEDKVKDDTENKEDAEIVPAEIKQDESSSVGSLELKPEENEKPNTDDSQMDLGSDSKITEQEEKSAESTENKEQKETSEDTLEKSDEKSYAAENAPADKIESTDTEPEKADETIKEQTETEEQNSKQSTNEESDKSDTAAEETTETATEDKHIENMEQSENTKEKEEVESNKEESSQETADGNGDKTEEKPVENETATGNIKVPDTSQTEKDMKENAEEKTDSVMDAIDELLQTANEATEKESVEETKEPTSKSTESNETTDNVETKESENIEMTAIENKVENEVPEKTEDTADFNDKSSASTEDVEMGNSSTQKEPASESKVDALLTNSESTEEKSEVADSISQENIRLRETDCELKTGDDNDSTINTETSKVENEMPSLTANTKEHKRKLTTDLADDISPKKVKLQCVRPKDVKRIQKGATFWPSNFRQKLCTCGECLSMYKDLKVLFLTDLEDTVFAYESLGKENVDCGASQYEKGMQALSSLGRIQQINALTEYNRMRDKLLDFLKSFKDRKEIVKEEDIKAFFAGMKPRREPDGVYFCR